MRMALLHPLVFVGMLILVFGAQAITIASGPSAVVVMPVIMAGVLVPLFWAHGIYIVAAARSAARGSAVLFPATELAVGIAFVTVLVLGPERVQTLAGGAPALVVIPYFVCLWLAAAALVRAEERGVAKLAPTLGTFLLMVYWFIGAWFVRPRVKQLLIA